MTASEAALLRERDPELVVLIVDAPVLWPLFAAHRAVIKALESEDFEFDARDYRNHMGWIGGLWSRPLLAANGQLITEVQIKQCEELLFADTLLGRVVREARHVRANKLLIDDLAQKLCEAICLSTLDEGHLVAVDSSRACHSLQAIDALRCELGLPAISRVRSWPKRVEASGAALMFGAPRFDHAQFRWAFWPPVAPKVVQVVWKPLFRYATPCIEWLERQPWEWKVRYETVSFPPPPNASLATESAPSSSLIEQLSDGWHALKNVYASARYGAIQRERIFKRLGSNVCISDARHKDAPSAPFLLSIDCMGKMNEAEAAPLGDDCIWVLARPAGTASLADRQKVHAFPELLEFKSRLRVLSATARAEVTRLISSKGLMRAQSVEGNYDKWCSSRPEDPYLPRSDEVFALLAERVGLTGSCARALRKKVDSQISKHLSQGLNEAHAWRNGAELEQLGSDALAQLKRGDEVEVVVSIGGDSLGTLELVPLSEELSTEWQE